MSFSFRPLFLVLVSSSFVVACYTAPRVPGGDVTTTHSASLSERSPIDVAVAPIQNDSGNASLPASWLRESFWRGLVSRRYSPLALEQVDRQVTDAAYRPGALDEQAVLLIKVAKWDDSLWSVNNTLQFTLTAKLVDPADPSNVMWSGKLDQRYSVSDDSEHFATIEGLMRHACDGIATQVLAALPPHDPKPGRVSK